MKKLLGILSAMTISISGVSVTSCSLVNYEKEYIKNKVKSIVDVSNVALRAGIINDASGINVDYLSQIIDGSRMVDMLEDYQGQPQTKVGDLRSTFFNQTYDRNLFTSLNENSNLDLSKSLDPNTQYDSTLSTLSIVLAALKSIGGVKPSLAGTLETVLPLLTGSISEDIDVNIDINISDEIIDIIQVILNVLGDSQLGELLVSVFFDVNYIKFNKINTKYIKDFTNKLISSGFLNKLLSSSFPKVLETYINNAMFRDYAGEGELTFAKIEHSSIIRFTNLLIDLSGEPQENKKSNWDSVDKNFINKNLTNALKKLITQPDNINFSALINAIPDIFYIIGSLMIKIGVLDFTAITPKDSDHLFDDTKNNIDYIKDFNNQKFESDFEYKKMIKNLQLALNPDEENGYNLQKILILSLFSNKSGFKAFPEKKPLLGWLPWLITQTNAAGIDSFLGALITSLGNIILDLIPDVPELAKPFSGNVSSLLTMVIETLILNKPLTGIPSLIEFVNSLGININLNLTNPDELKKPFNGIWNKDSHLLTDLTGIKIKDQLLNLSNILSITLIDNKTISKILEDYYKALEQFDPKDYWNNQLSVGLKSLNNLNFKEEITLYNKNNEIQTNFINAIIKLSNNKSLGIKTKDEDKILYGTKGAMYLLGYDASTTSFMEGSLFKILENAFDDTGVSNIIYSINDGLKNVSDSKNEFIATKLMPYINRNNFTYKISNYDNITSTDNLGTIDYKIIYKDPFTDKKYTYLVKLVETQDKKFWNLNSIKKQS
ncbi:MOLPALP family lipoprotein [Spiroplasma culicicola]|uniref:MOLPALP family lipoprotein n=1 Tax=Spiroplasma culicicola AES-1 TaxID=1276246 RepID=W6A6Y4_9MOLU|nr:MOLPALP family lipoprotein [Spiroplasma culicicola]AHI52731.1 hypothetical protein SCULI_v1c03900 [Spiroplasma culicicola AES-1]